MTDDMKQQYTLLVEFLGKALGPDYEVVLHDAEDHIRSIVAIANGHVSQRSVGGPITNLGLEVLSDEAYREVDYKVNYNGISKDHRVLRSSTMFIRDDEETIVGMLCINFDDRRYKELSSRILHLCHPDALIESNSRHDSIDSLVKQAETFYDSVAEQADNVIAAYLQEKGIGPERLSQEDRVFLVGALNQAGLFHMKGAVREAAKQLNCSEPTIYRYLNKIQHEKRAP